VTPSQFIGTRQRQVIALANCLLKFLFGEKTLTRSRFTLDFAEDIGIDLAVEGGVEGIMKCFP